MDAGVESGLRAHCRRSVSGGQELRGLKGAEAGAADPAALVGKVVTRTRTRPLGVWCPESGRMRPSSRVSGRGHLCRSRSSRCPCLLGWRGPECPNFQWERLPDSASKDSVPLPFGGGSWGPPGWDPARPFSGVDTRGSGIQRAKGRWCLSTVGCPLRVPWEWWGSGLSGSSGPSARSRTGRVLGMSPMCQEPVAGCRVLRPEAGPWEPGVGVGMRPRSHAVSCVCWAC